MNFKKILAGLAAGLLVVLFSPFLFFFVTGTILAFVAANLFWLTLWSWKVLHNQSTDDWQWEDIVWKRIVGELLWFAKWR